MEVEVLRKLKSYKPTKFKAKDSTYNKEAADYAVNFIELNLMTAQTIDLIDPDGNTGS